LVSGLQDLPEGFVVAMALLSVNYKPSRALALAGGAML
jgi:zinc transporter ZupT